MGSETLNSWTPEINVSDPIDLSVCIHVLGRVVFGCFSSSGIVWIIWSRWVSWVVGSVSFCKSCFICWVSSL